MTIRRTCSWCHEPNVIPGDGRPVWCGCGHRADLPRLLCDCGRPGCQPRRRDEATDDTDVED